MKVTVEGTTAELLDLAELLVLGRTSCRAVEEPAKVDPSATNVRPVHLGDDVPNRYREEGVQ